MVHLDDDVFVDGEAVHGLMIICTIERRRAINGVVRKGDQNARKMASFELSQKIISR